MNLQARNYIVMGLTESWCCFVRLAFRPSPHVFAEPCKWFPLGRKILYHSKPVPRTEAIANVYGTGENEHRHRLSDESAQVSLGCPMPRCTMRIPEKALPGAQTS